MTLFNIYTMMRSGKMMADQKDSMKRLVEALVSASASARVEGERIAVEFDTGANPGSSLERVEKRLSRKLGGGIPFTVQEVDAEPDIIMHSQASDAEPKWEESIAQRVKLSIDIGHGQDKFATLAKAHADGKKIAARLEKLLGEKSWIRVKAGTVTVNTPEYFIRDDIIDIQEAALGSEFQTDKDSDRTVRVSVPGFTFVEQGKWVDRKTPDKIYYGLVVTVPEDANISAAIIGNLGTLVQKKSATAIVERVAAAEHEAAVAKARVAAVAAKLEEKKKAPERHLENVEQFKKLMEEMGATVVPTVDEDDAPSRTSSLLSISATREEAQALGSNLQHLLTDATADRSPRPIGAVKVVVTPEQPTARSFVARAAQGGQSRYDVHVLYYAERAVNPGVPLNTIATLLYMARGRLANDKKGDSYEYGMPAPRQRG